LTQMILRAVLLFGLPMMGIATTVSVSCGGVSAVLVGDTAGCSTTEYFAEATVAPSYGGLVSASKTGPTSDPDAVAKIFRNR